MTDYAQMVHVLAYALEFESCIHLVAGSQELYSCSHHDPQVWFATVQAQSKMQCQDIDSMPCLTQDSQVSFATKIILQALAAINYAAARTRMCQNLPVIQRHCRLTA